MKKSVLYISSIAALAFAQAASAQGNFNRFGVKPVSSSTKKSSNPRVVIPNSRFLPPTVVNPVAPKKIYPVNPKIEIPVVPINPRPNPGLNVRPGVPIRPVLPVKPILPVRPVQPIDPYVPPRGTVTPKPPSRPVVIPKKDPVPPPVKLIGASAMVDILRGKVVGGSVSKAPTVSSTVPRAGVLDRIVRVDPNTLPKGMGTTNTTFMKRGKTPAEGEGGSVYLPMKKGKDNAESDPYSDIVVRIKDGRPSAETDPVPPVHGGGSGSGGGSYTGGGSSGGPSLAYRVDSSSQLSTDSVRFRKASTQLADSRSFQYLQALSEALRDPSLAGERFVIEGHASADGSDATNLRLSQQRANMIFDFMVSRGVDPNRLLSVGHGEYQARYSAYQPEYLLAQDRRVIVFRLAE